MKFSCPKEGCDGEIELPDAPTLDQISNTLKESLKGQLKTEEVERVIREQLEGLKPPKEDHRHKTADELLDCPDCRSWVDKTSQKYQVTPKEEEPKKTTFPFGSIRAKETE